MKTILLSLLVSLSPLQAVAAEALSGKVWHAGTADCDEDRAPAIEVFAFDADSYILRQNKCLHFEAPFIYVLFGGHTVFVQDTGATAEPDQFPLYATVQDLIARRGGDPLQILVTHSHGHGDHKAADGQFRGQSGVTLVEPDALAMRTHFGFTQWPEGSTNIDLGGRVLEVLPSPGHHEAGIAVYDTRTGWLLTGDNLYPGRLYVSDWNAYRASIGRLADFARSRPVSAVLGAHIEISRDGELFRLGSTHQPGEASLVLTAEDLQQLDQRLREAGDEPGRIEMDKFVVTPIGFVQRTLSRVLKWFDAL